VNGGPCWGCNGKGKRRYLVHYRPFAWLWVVVAGLLLLLSVGPMVLPALNRALGR